MDSWLKKAEEVSNSRQPKGVGLSTEIPLQVGSRIAWLHWVVGFLEVVDRGAKRVVSEFSDEQADLQSTVANGQGSQAKRKSKTKAQKRVPVNESVTLQEQTSTVTSLVDVTPENDRASQLIENERTPTKSVAQTNDGQQHSINKDSPMVGIPLTETLANDVVKNDADDMEVLSTVADVEAVPLHSNSELVNENTSDVHKEQPPLSLPANGVNIVDEDEPIDAGQSKSGDTDDTGNIDQERSQSVSTDSPSNSETQLKDADVKVEPLIYQNRQQGTKADGSPMKVQDPLDEAQGLLKTTVSTGQSKEARLARVCAGLSSRLQEYKSENAQLEELLIAERELSKSYEAHIKQLQQDLSAAKGDVSRVESNMVEALAAKNSEIEALISSMDALKKQAALSEGNLASLQANMESIMRNRELTETRMMQAMREELASAERRAEEERAAHNATKMAAMEREVELEHRAVDASSALARIQRIADERTAKVAELEQKVALLEVECASLNQELQDMEARVRRGQKKSPEEANQVIQVLQLTFQPYSIDSRGLLLIKCRHGRKKLNVHAKAREMLRANSLLWRQAEVQKTRVEMAAMKRDAEHYSRQYYKQTQLEAMASEKAAAEFQLEKELKRLQEAQVEADRNKVSRRASTSWEEDTEMKALEPLPLYHRHMVGASIQLQKAAKLLDTGAVRATRFLWRYPTARVILLFYLVRTVQIGLILKITEGFELFDNYKKSSSGICTSLLDVSVASASGMYFWHRQTILLLEKLQNLWDFQTLPYHDWSAAPIGKLVQRVSKASFIFARVHLF
ncbi:golgin candidate 1 [Quercus suber]|uniref:Golgin candidate 1 n=1 Tax=Quercus suber TaxID=58331 RepID=A0AAW0L3T5_QUESU